MLVLDHASLATVEELFKFKESKFSLPEFPGYSNDQWGIKAHNRPWIENNGQFAENQRIIEIGGAYSSFPNYLGEKYNLEPWIGDDFGKSEGDDMWKRWGNPNNLPKKNTRTKYIFENFGNFSESFQDNYYDRIFSISTLEHIPTSKRLNVLKDANRCLKKGGIQLHTIDIRSSNLNRILLNSVTDSFSFIYKGYQLKLFSEIVHWFNLFESSGVKIQDRKPRIWDVIKRSTLLESYDVFYNFYPPMERTKKYNPTASLLLIIRDI